MATKRWLALPAVVARSAAALAAFLVFALGLMSTLRAGFGEAEQARGVEGGSLGAAERVGVLASEVRAW